jgi:oligosaccharide repeat unit polymerase
MMFFIFYVCILSILFLRYWMAHRDLFHPAMILIPQFIFLYALFPIMSYSSDPDRFMALAGGPELVWYQLLTLALPFCVLSGVTAGSRRTVTSSPVWESISITNASVVRGTAIVLGLTALGAWLYMLGQVGGFSSAYGHAYGGGWSDSGYILEMPQVGIVGALLIFLLRTGKGVRPVDWLIVFGCILPVMTHGILGARRGPTFISIMTVAGGYLYFTRRRISLSIAVPAGIMVGTVILFIIANRDDIYLGSEITQFRSPTEFFNAWTSNEYLIGSAVVRYTQVTDGFYGRRELLHIVARMFPKIWPTVYEDLGDVFKLSINLKLNAGVDPVAIGNYVGWRPTVGSATGFVGSLWQEFQYISPFVAFLTGYLYGVAWRGAARSVFWRLFYLVIAALSIYLVMQDIDAWLYRVIMLGLPVFFIARMVAVQRRSATLGGAFPGSQERPALPH